jgi:hypothetical protein
MKTTTALISLLMLSVGICWASAQTSPIKSRFEATLTPDKPSFVLGESAALNYCLENKSNKPIVVTSGFSAFKVTAKDAQGVEQPQPHPMGSGEELSSPQFIDSGKRWCQSIRLSGYLDIKQSGTFNISVTFTSPPDSLFVLSDDQKHVSINAWNLDAAIPPSSQTDSTVSIVNRKPDAAAPEPIEAHTLVTFEKAKQ